MRRNIYELRDERILPNTKSFERCKFFLVEREHLNKKYLDVAINCDGFVFVLQPKQYYSAKTHYVFQKMLHAIAQDKYVDESSDL